MDPKIDRLFRSDFSRSQIELNRQVETFGGEQAPRHSTSQSVYSDIKDFKQVNIQTIAEQVENKNLTQSKDFKIIIRNHHSSIEVPSLQTKKMKTGGLSEFPHLTGVVPSKIKASAAQTSSQLTGYNKNLTSSNTEELSYLAPMNLKIEGSQPKSMHDNIELKQDNVRTLYSHEVSER